MDFVWHNMLTLVNIDNGDMYLQASIVFRLSINPVTKTNQAYVIDLIKEEYDIEFMLNNRIKCLEIIR